MQASADENPELFWALRGGGGNFGVVTSFEFELHEMGPTVMAGPVAWPFEQAPTVLREVENVMRQAPDEVSVLPVLRHAPPASFLPEDVHGERVLIVPMIYAGELGAGEQALAPLREIGDPITDRVGPMPYVALQSMFDAASGPGARNYWKSHYLPELGGDAIDVLCEHAAEMTSMESVIGMLSLGGAVAREPAESTPYPHRGARWVVNIQSRWRDPEEDKRHIEWCRGLFEDLAEHSTGGVYVNFISGDEGPDRVHDAYGSKIHERLQAVKGAWDPDNVFHLNRNIQPPADADGG